MTGKPMTYSEIERFIRLVKKAIKKAKKNNY